MLGGVYVVSNLLVSTIFAKGLEKSRPFCFSGRRHLEGVHRGDPSGALRRATTSPRSQPPWDLAIELRSWVAWNFLDLGRQRKPDSIFPEGKIEERRVCPAIRPPGKPIHDGHGRIFCPPVASLASPIFQPWILTQ